MYNNDENKSHLNVVFDDGGIGDHVGRLPAVQYILDNHPHITVHLWLPDYFLEFAERSLKAGDNLILRGFSEQKKYKMFETRAFKIHRYTNMAAHQTDHAFAMLCHTQVDNKYKNYLPLNTDDVDISMAEQHDADNGAVVITTGFTASVREMLPKTVNEIAQYILNKGYTPIFLGKKEAHNGDTFTIKADFNKEIDFSVGLDLRDKTSLVQTQKIISSCAAIVGLDNGLLHIAGTTEVPIVGGFTTVKPEHRMPYRHDTLGWNYYPVTPSDNIKCRFCQSNMTFTYDHDFRYCYYDIKAKGEKIACVSDLTAVKYIEQLEKIL